MRSGLQLSFVTMTVFGTGAAPTVTVTPLPQMITQQVTVTVNQAAAAGGSAAGTGGAGAAKYDITSQMSRNTNSYSGLQLSFVTMTVFGSGPAPTVTVTPLPQMITQQVTVTVNQAAAGVSPPAGVAAGSAAGTLTTAAIVSKQSNAAGSARKFLPMFHRLTQKLMNIAKASAAAGVNPPAGVAAGSAAGTLTTAAIVSKQSNAAGSARMLPSYLLRRMEFNE